MDCAVDEISESRRHLPVPSLDHSASQQLTHISGCGGSDPRKVSLAELLCSRTTVTQEWLSGLAANTSFVGVGTGKTLTDSGNGNFIGTINAPGYDITISGNGAFVGALIGDTLTISGNGGFHYDQALGAGANLVANFAYGSWFEDNSDPTRGMSF